MAAHRKTLAAHIASGSVATNPGRFVDRTNPPVPLAPIKKAPRHLDAALQKVWREIVSSAPVGLLGTCDVILIESAVRLTYKMRNFPDKFTSTDNGQLINVMGKLGGTPGDRMRLNCKTPSDNTKSADPLDELD
jgi:hypothetical protein